MGWGWDVADTHAGELLVDNSACCIGAALRDGGQQFLEEAVDLHRFRYFGLGERTDLVPWTRAGGLDAKELPLESTNPLIAGIQDPNYHARRHAPARSPRLGNVDHLRHHAAGRRLHS